MDDESQWTSVEGSLLKVNLARRIEFIPLLALVVLHFHCGQHEMNERVFEKL